MATRRAAGLGVVNNFLCMPGQTGNDLYPGNAAQPSAARTPAASTGTRFCVRPRHPHPASAGRRLDPAIVSAVVIERVGGLDRGVSAR